MAVATRTSRIRVVDGRLSVVTPITRGPESVVQVKDLVRHAFIAGAEWGVAQTDGYIYGEGGGHTEDIHLFDDVVEPAECKVSELALPAATRYAEES